jgi:N6-adenosine-specific RNA methylase IME4
VNLPSKRYSVIYADPPWSFGGRKLNASTNGKELSDHYPSMSDDELLSLPVNQIAAKDAWLFMWVVYAKLPIALRVMEEWGFSYKTVAFEWLKRTEKGKPVCFMGGTVCGGAIELCLLGKRGSLSRVCKRVRRLIDAPRGRHSEKPREARERIVELVGDVPRIELFAREGVVGWDAWGNEVPDAGFAK